MVVVAIIGITATIAVPTYIKLLPQIRVKHAARDVSSDLNLARMKAISTNSNVTVTFSEGSYSGGGLGSVSGRDWYGKAVFHFPSATGKYALPYADQRRVIFDYYGKASSIVAAGNVEAIYVKGKNFQQGDYESRVKISKYTGKTTVEYWNRTANAWAEK